MAVFLASPNYDFVANKAIMIEGLQNALAYLCDELSIAAPALEHPSWQNFGFYNRAVAQLEANIIKEGTESLRDSCIPWPVKSLSVRAFNESDMSTGEIGLIREALLMDTDRVSRADYLIDHALFAREEQRIRAALNIIKLGAPEFFEEAATLVNEIILTAGEETGFMRSGSSFILYSAIFMMTHDTNTIPYYIEHLIHEVAHMALYPINSQDELTLNAPDERFSAPLRSDLRPMSGLYHAAFVLCRIAQALSKVQDFVEPQDLPELQHRLRKAISRFASTVETIEMHGKLTELGLNILQQCKEATATVSVR